MARCWELSFSIFFIFCIFFFFVIGGEVLGAVGGSSGGDDGAARQNEASHGTLPQYGAGWVKKNKEKK